MFGQDDDGFVIQQALVPGLLQVGGEFAVQAFGALIVGGKQFGLDAQQIAAVGGGALIDREIDAQVRQVMAHRAVRGPHGVGRKCGDQRHGERQVQKFAHGETVNSRMQGAWLFIGIKDKANQGVSGEICVRRVFRSSSCHAR